LRPTRIRDYTMKKTRLLNLVAGTLLVMIFVLILSSKSGSGKRDDGKGTFNELLQQREENNRKKVIENAAVEQQRIRQPLETSVANTDKVENKPTKTNTAEKKEVKTEKVVVLGIWADDMTAGVVWRIIKKENGVHMLEIGRPWQYPKELKKITKNGKVVYLDTDNNEEYYRIDSNGDLSVFDNYGYITTYKKSN